MRERVLVMRAAIVALIALAAGCAPGDHAAAQDAASAIDAGDITMVDAPPACVAEPDATFCTRLGANCGELTADDNCGHSRTAACGTCAAGSACGSSNVCGCEPETAQELCSAAQAACGSITAVDHCGATRTVTCPNTCNSGETCGGGWADNLCGATTCTADGWCRPTTASISSLFDFNAVWTATASSGWAAGYGGLAGGGKLYRWNGTTWHAVATTNRGLYAITGTGANDVWIAGGYGFTWHYSGGTTLATGMAGCFDCDVFDLWAIGPQDVWGVGYDHKAMHFEGSGWGVSDLFPVPAAPRGVWAAAPANVWVVGDGGSVRHWNGLDWTASTVGTSDLLDVWGSGASDIWAAGSGGRLVHYDGHTWNTVASGTTQTLRAVTGTDAAHVWFAGDNGALLFWNGSALAPQQSGTTRSIHSLWARSPTDIWAVGAAGLILHHS